MGSVAPPGMPETAIKFVQDQRQGRARGSTLISVLATAEPSMAKKFPLHPKHPERVCWGCDKYCAADSMMCGNGSSRTMHPAELLGDDWYTVGDWDLGEPAAPCSAGAAASPGGPG